MADALKPENRAAAAARATWRGSYLSAVFALLAVLAVLAHKAAVPLLLLLAFAAPNPSRVWRDARAAFPPTLKTWFGALVLAATGFSLFVALSALWSPMPEKADWSWRYAFAFLVAGLAFYNAASLNLADRNLAARGFAWAVLAMAILFAFERLSGGLLRELIPPAQPHAEAQVSLGRGALILMALIWPAKAILTRNARPRLGWALILIAAAPAFGFSIETNAAAFLLALMTYALARRYPRTVLKVVFSGLVLALWLAPVIAANLPVEFIAERAGLPTSWMQRVHIWRYTGGEIFAHPFGGGVEYARSLTETAPRIVVDGIVSTAMPLHPHNFALHLWMDLGLIGVALMTLALVAVYKGVRAAQGDPLFVATVSAVLASFFVTAMTDWNMWQVWRFALVWFAAIGALFTLKRPSPEKAERQAGARTGRFATGGGRAR